MPEVKKHMNIVNLISVILIIVGLVWMFHTIYRNWKIKQIASWPKAKATILRSYAEVSEFGNNPEVSTKSIIVAPGNTKNYKPQVSYRYRVATTDYESDNLVYSGQNKYNAAETKTLLNPIPAGTRIDVYYNPRRPRESYIYNGSSSSNGVISGLVLVLLGIILGGYNVAKVVKDDEISTGETEVRVPSGTPVAIKTSNYYRRARDLY